MDYFTLLVTELAVRYFKQENELRGIPLRAVNIFCS